MFRFTRKSLFLFIIMVFCSLAGSVFALGGDSDGEDAIPLPQVNFSVEVVDIKGVKSKATRVSWDGKVFVRGKRGEALTTVPFEKIKKIEMNPQKEATKGTIASTITLKTDQRIQLEIASNSKCFGETEFGKFEIFLRDIQSIDFL